MNEKDIELLKSTAKSHAAMMLTMDRFCTIPNQRAVVCRHYPCEMKGYHNHDFFEINYVKRGNCVNFIEDRALYMSEGAFILLHPDVFHTVYAPDENCEVYNVLLRKEWFLETVKSYALPDTAMGRFISLAETASCPEYVYSTHTSASANALLCTLYDNRESVSLVTEGQILLCLAELIGERSCVLSPRQITSDGTMLKLLSFIDQNFNSVTLDSLSEYVGYSKTHICRLFRKHLKKSFGEVVRSIRREHAEYFLRSTDRQISEISAMIGYENTEHFCRVFKKGTDLTPSEYRQKYRSRKS
ncbi:MAG: helix-turn-helix domain-containing protein [Clostridia bacterium]|nr:helix-turn-helix domain-containing protein [Clostridia bacterium]